MADPTSTLTTEQLNELAPLAAVIADKVSTVPVRHCLGGTDDLVAELTLAVAVYVGRHVLPAELLQLRHPPIPTDTGWIVQAQRRSGKWEDWGPAYPNRDDARRLYESLADGNSGPLRLVRKVTSYVAEAEHTPGERP
ncbi:hypothetical protein G9272_32225 [Streptomyces asoensis]|uniref:Uncharacterized protein n=1 Tax=Streptomyces asoensis TaxID=249586 RepID=A0A6M4X292_9ACTN|nr:hypothetical protein [Streptomyces asoensis]QJT04386.1 hypothetical protein G9272_32225 [Streptomyces asoensis]